MRLRAALLPLLLALLPGCGGDDLEDRFDGTRADVRERIEQARGEFEERRERFGERIREVPPA